MNLCHAILRIAREANDRPIICILQCLLVDHQRRQIWWLYIIFVNDMWKNLPHLYVGLRTSFADIYLQSFNIVFQLSVHINLQSFNIVFQLSVHIIFTHVSASYSFQTFLRGTCYGGLIWGIFYFYSALNYTGSISTDSSSLSHHHHDCFHYRRHCCWQQLAPSAAAEHNLHLLWSWRCIIFFCNCCLSQSMNESLILQKILVSQLSIGLVIPCHFDHELIEPFNARIRPTPF